ncbi:3-deoxy-7-phosphoheptulonate synthase [Longispora albida]|uniref:3-deoxy-7-phosphoheptulonate synthase n=1 Tax=Longispora albida TaxID=203523 RepID=UPI00035E9966|nr:3-deoxy-7-phosphoheptulonate synthase [Longispora albida]
MITLEADRRLVTATELRSGLPLDAPDRILRQRAEIRAILDGEDDRLLVLAGPCSIHDPIAGLDYARRLASAAAAHRADLLIVMRAYLEKPRTIVGWKGMLTDPGLDGGSDLDTGLRISRKFLLAAHGAGLPLACEFVDPMLAGYLADLVSWGCIGARTVESQPHRQLGSWLPMPVGFKNATSGDVGPAVHAVQAASAGHVFAGLGDEGEPAVIRSHGNTHGHVVLRGGERTGPNYEATSVGAALKLLRGAGLRETVVVDASHGNSGKDHRRQPVVIDNLAGQLAAGQHGLAGIMIESFLAEGAQPIRPGRLEYGRSITDACLSWEHTTDQLDVLARAVRARRETARR